MKRLVKLGCTLFMLMSSSAMVSAEPLTGTANFYLGSPVPALPPEPITGDLDADTGSLSFDPFLFFFQPFLTNNAELLGPGVHVRPDGGGGIISATIAPGQSGAYLELEWNFNALSTFMVWDVTPAPGGDYQYTTIDSDGDGAPGHAFVAGPFPGLSVAYDFITADGAGPEVPGVFIAVVVQGGPNQECTEWGGSTVSAMAQVGLTGGAVLESLSWTVDGNDAGSGPSISRFLPLGAHEIGITALTTTGESDTDEVTVSVSDTTRPSLEVAFVNMRGEPITEHKSGALRTRIAATDVCDPDPQTSGRVQPFYGVNDGNKLVVTKGTLKLPVSGLSLTGDAEDASGNRTSSSPELLNVTH